MNRLHGSALTVQRIVTCTYHLNLPAVTSIYGWRYQARYYWYYCGYANGLPCLFRLRESPLTLELKLLHPCASFWETNYKNALQQVLCKLWFTDYLNFTKYFGKYRFINYQYSIWSIKETKLKGLAKQTGSFKIKLDKNVILKLYLYFNLLFAVFQVIHLVFLNILRYTAHYMTVSKSINLNWYFNKLFVAAV